MPGNARSQAGAGAPGILPDRVPRLTGRAPSLETRVFSFLRRFGTPQIDVDELDALLQQGSLLVLDVREDSEFKGGHLRGAIHVPVNKLPDRLGRLKRDRRYAVICQSGSRSRRATDYLIEQGFEGTVSVRGGTGAWARSGRALVR